MKKLFVILAILLLIPLGTRASVTVPFTATSTDNGFISPALVNGHADGLILNALLQAFQALTTTFFNATSTTATSTITNALQIGGASNVTGSPYLLISSTSPVYGYLQGDLIDAGISANSYAAINTFNNGTGTCAQDGFIANNNNPSLTAGFVDFMETNDGWTGVGCSLLSPTNVNPDSGYTYNPSWDLDQVLGTTSPTVAGVPIGFKWLTNNGSTQVAVLTEAGNFGIASATPYALLSVGNTGGIGFSLATSTFNTTGGININAGCYAFAGTCLKQNLGTVTSITATSPLTGGTITTSGSIGIQAASASQNGYLSLTDYQLLHTATTTFSSPLTYTLGTNAVTCSTCNTTNATVSSVGLSSSGSLTIGSSPITTSGTLTANLNLANANSWTALQSFANSSTTLATAGTLWDSGLTSGDCVQAGTGGLLTSAASACGSGGGGGTPGGASSTIQYNANGAFGGASDIYTDGTNFGIGTSTPAFPLSLGTVTSPLNAWLNSTNVHIGTSTCPSSNNDFGGEGLEVCGDNNNNGGVNLLLENQNPGTLAFADLVLGNDGTKGNINNYAVLNFNSQEYNSGSFGGEASIPFGLNLTNTEGPEAIGDASTTNLTNQYISIYAGGPNFSNEIARFVPNANGIGGKVGIGTTTPGAILAVANNAYASLTPTESLLISSTSPGLAATTTLFEVVPAGVNGVQTLGGEVEVNSLVNCIATASSCNYTYVGGARLGLNSAGTSFYGGNSNTAPSFEFVGNTTNAIAVSTDVPLLQIGSYVLRTHATGAAAENDQVLYVPLGDTFAVGTAANSVISTSSAVTIQGLPGIGARGSITNDYGLLINATTTLTSASTTNAYGLAVFASSGAANNYAIYSSGGLFFNNLPSVTTGDYLCDNAGVIEAGTTCSLSSQKVKNHITVLPQSAGLSDILKLQPVTFFYDKGFGDSGASKQTGLVAEQAAAANPLFAEYNTGKPIKTPNGVIATGAPDGIDWNAVTASLVISVQQLQAEKQGAMHDAEDEWQNLALAILGTLFVLYVLYNELTKRK